MTPTQCRGVAARRIARRSATATAILLLLGLASPAQASFLPHHVVDKLADILAVVVLILVPVIAIVVFWLVHILPEKIAHDRHHPQFEAIQVLCLLSLVFGGILWPLAWIWAYTKPVLHKMAYGTDVPDDAPEGARHGKQKKVAKTATTEVARLKDGIDALEKRGVAPDELRGLREQLASLEATIAKDGAA